MCVHHILGQEERLRKDHGEDFDAIMIFVGTNDYNAGVPIGEWFEEESVVVNADGRMVERIRRKPIFDRDTYRGRINCTLDSLKRMYPAKQIVLLTPIHRAYARFGDRNVQPDESHQNSCGEYVDAYVESVKEASPQRRRPQTSGNVSVLSASGVALQFFRSAAYSTVILPSVLYLMFFSGSFDAR